MTQQASPPADAAGWLQWWDRTRVAVPPQCLPPKPVPQAWLLGELVTGSIEHALGQAEVVLIGRDARCQLELSDPSLSRLHAAVIRLSSRWAVVDRQSRTGTRLNGAPIQAGWLDPGDRLQVGNVSLELRVAEPVPARTAAGHLVLDPLTFEALEERSHPSACAGLVELVRRAERVDWCAAAARALFPDAAAAEAFSAELIGLVRRRAAQAPARLTAMLGQPPSPGADGWAQLLAARLPSLPLQVVPAGWLET